MDEILAQGQSVLMEKAANVVVDIESLAQAQDISSGSPKMKKALSRKGSCRIERRTAEEQDAEEASKRLVVKVASTPIEVKQPLISSKSFVSLSSSMGNSCGLSDVCDGRNKKFGRFISNPRKVVLLFATMSSVGTLVLIYFTLALNRTAGS